MDFSTTLLREKFVIRDTRLEGSADDIPVIALSNRIVLKFTDSKGTLSEVFVVRSMMMHACIRMAAKIVNTYFRTGPLMVREEKFDFEDAWDDITHDHEKQFNPKNWVAIYNSGRRIFSQGEYHAFFDVIENCEHKNTSGQYEKSISIAEDIFAKTGRPVTIEHDANTGMILDIRKDKAKCGMILRSPVKRNNFNFTSTEIAGRESKINVSQCLTISAAFLEGIHLAFIIGRTNERLRLEEIPKYGDDDKFATSARRRLARLNAEIKSFENAYTVHYRPEKPEFPQTVIEAEKYTKKLWERAQALKQDEAEVESTLAETAMPEMNAQL